MKLSTKILAVAFVVAIALVVAIPASAAGFTQNLTVGSRGAEVTQLQTVLGVTPATGYFGAITKAAVVSYQASKGIPATGFVGPLTRTSLNGAAPVTSTVAGCAAGAAFSSTTGAPCTASTTLPAGCVAGAMFSSTTGASCSAGAVVSANGTDGTLTPAASSYVSSGITLKKGDTKNILAINLKASVGPVTVTRAAVHFNTRPWLVLSQVTLKDSNGKALATKSLSSAADATEITVGSDYLVDFGNINYTVTPGQNVDLVVGATVLSATDKINGTLVLHSAFDSIRTSNGIGWTDSVGGFTGSVPSSGVGANSVTLSSTASTAEINVRISPSTPVTRQQAVSVTNTTSDVVLGLFSLMSANNSSTLNELTVAIATSSIPNPTAAFSNVRLVTGNNTYGGILSSNGSVAFTNLTIPLSQDVWQDFSIKADVAANISGTASVSLIPNTTNIVVTDANYNTATVVGSTATSNVITFTTNALNLVSATMTSTDPISGACGSVSCTTGYNIAASVVLQNTSKNDLYVSATSTTFLTQVPTNTTLASSSLSTVQSVVTNGDASPLAGDVTGVAYVIQSGMTRTFNLTGAIRGATGTNGVNLKVTSVTYGTGSADGSNHGTPITSGIQGLNLTKSF